MEISTIEKKKNRIVFQVTVRDEKDVEILAYILATSIDSQFSYEVSEDEIKEFIDEKYGEYLDFSKSAYLMDIELYITRRGVESSFRIRRPNKDGWIVQDI